jgi:hypothetical protein
MPSNDSMTKQKEQDFSGIISCSVAAGVWWFISSTPTNAALAGAGCLLVFLFSVFCILAVMLPGPEGEEQTVSFAPLPQYDTERRKALTY